MRMWTWQRADLSPDDRALGRRLVAESTVRGPAPPLSAPRLGDLFGARVLIIRNPDKLARIRMQA